MEHGPFTEMIGGVRGKRVLDIGCGGGQLASYLAEAGAAQVTATDASERMLQVAREQRSHPRVTYELVSMEDADYPADAFELVVSSLAFHYVADYAGLLERVARWLTDDGLLVFSTEHPIYAARSTDEGWVTDAEGRSVGWAVDDYAVEGLRERHWYIGGVHRYHRMLSTILNGLIGAGFVIERVEESWPTEAWLREHPDHAEELRRPMFLLVKARRSR
jgi:2-polyprenyl-3-methyl-5-hydroxy-6-metoxy-1,4-benzoquinol methylase